MSALIFHKDIFQIRGSTMSSNAKFSQLLLHCFAIASFQKFKYSQSKHFCLKFNHGIFIVYYYLCKNMQTICPPLPVFLYFYRHSFFVSELYPINFEHFSLQGNPVFKDSKDGVGRN